MKLWKMITKNITSFVKDGVGAVCDKLSNASIYVSCLQLYSGIEENILQKWKDGGLKGRGMSIEQEVT